MLYYILLILNHLKLAWNLLLQLSFFPNIDHTFQAHPPHYFPPSVDVIVDRRLQLGVVRYNGRGGCVDEDEEVACAVCLCKIEQDDEMRELRCNHLFHKVCLDRWLACSYSSTCPTCRTLLTPAKLVSGVEVLMLKSLTLSSEHHRDNWWLR